MSKYKRLKKEHDELKASVKKLINILMWNGSIVKPSIFPCYSDMIAGEHTDEIEKAQVDANTALFRINKLVEHLGLELKHTHINEWKFVERKDTDE